MLSHQKNPKFRLAQKLVGLTTLVLLALSFGPQPAAGGQKSAAEVAKSKEAAGLLLAKEALTNAVATYFGEGLDGTKTKKFFEGWTDSDWVSLLNKNFGFYAGASKLKAGEPGVEQLQQELYKKHSNQITGAIAETFHWVRWRKKIDQIAKNENYTDIEFLDEKALSKIFGYHSGRRCDGLVIANKSGKPPKRVILGVFESKLSASQVKSTQIGNFLDRIQANYGEGQDVSLIRLDQGQTKPIKDTNYDDTESIIKAAKSFHKEAARFLTGEESIHLLFTKVSLEFAGNVMGQNREQKKMLFDESLPLNKLAKFIRVKKEFPNLGKDASGEEIKLAKWLNNYFNEYEKEIKNYLRGRTDIDQAELEWMFEVKADPWKKQLPGLAKFIRDNKEFPTRGKDALDEERTLANWVYDYFKEHEDKIKAYLRGRTDIDQAELEWMFEVKADPWKKQLPKLAKFIRDKKRLPTSGKDALDDEERTLANWVYDYFEKYEKEIKNYLIGPGGIDDETLKWALDVKAEPWKKHLPKLAKFIRDIKEFPIRRNEASDEERKLAEWLHIYFKEHEDKIKAYLRGRTDIDQAELEWMFEVKADPWKKQLPGLAKFIRDNKEFPTRGKDALDEERTLANWVFGYFKEHEDKIKAYLRGPGGIDDETLQKALNARKPKPSWDDQLPMLAKFIRDNEQFPKQYAASEDERTLARWLLNHFGDEKKNQEILDYLEKHVDQAVLKKALNARKTRPRWDDQLLDLANFIRDNKQFPKRHAASEDERTLASWFVAHFNDEKKNPEILNYLEKHVDQAVLKKALNARKLQPRWDDQLPELAKFIRDNKEFPTRGKDASDEERTLGSWLINHFKGEEIPEILDYLRGRGDIDDYTLQKALEDFEKRKRGPRGSKIPATDANPDLGECDKELKGILSGLTSAA